MILSRNAAFLQVTDIVTDAATEKIPFVEMMKVVLLFSSWTIALFPMSAPRQDAAKKTAVALLEDEI